MLVATFMVPKQKKRPKTQTLWQGLHLLPVTGSSWHFPDTLTENYLNLVLC